MIQGDASINTAIMATVPSRNMFNRGKLAGASTKDRANREPLATIARPIGATATLFQIGQLGQMY